MTHKRDNSPPWLPVIVLLLTAGWWREAAAGELPVVCHRLPPLAPEIRPEDVAEEEAFCSIDTTSPLIALCPKTWSTSPAAIVYDLQGTEWVGKVAEFEQQACPPGGKARDKAHAEVAVFKNSLNGRETSGTFAPASLLYYHFSRLLETRLQVPVAVLAEFPSEPYRSRVVAPGINDTQSSRLKMLHAGWNEMDLALSDPAAYHHRRELFSQDNSRLWGVFLLSNGKRYGIELNGTRASGWGDGQNRDFQRTPPFIALRADRPLAEAIDYGLEQAAGDPAMAEVLAKPLSRPQMAWWMHELTELVILDTIFRQQDRIGNIDYLRRWVWLEGEDLKVSGSDPGRAEALKLRVTVLNDNDAGVRSGYANYAQRTDMLAGWHHMDAGLYQRVQKLGEDFASSGPVALAVHENYRLSRREAQGIIQRGIEVAAQLRERCEAGALRFDLGAANVLDPARAGELPPPCEQQELPAGEAVSD